MWKEIHDKLNMSYQAKNFFKEVRKANIKAHGKERKAKLYVMLFTETVYVVWLQRNNKVYNDMNVPPQVLVKEIIFLVSCNCNDADRTLLVY